MLANAHPAQYHASCGKQSDADSQSVSLESEGSHKGVKAMLLVGHTVLKRTICKKAVA